MQDEMWFNKMSQKNEFGSNTELRCMIGKYSAIDFFKCLY